MKTKSFNKQKHHKTGLVATATNGFMTHRQPYSGVHRIWKTQAQIHICYLPAGRSVWLKTVTEVLKILPEAVGRGQHFKTAVTVFHPTDRPLAGR